MLKEKNHLQTNKKKDEQILSFEQQCTFWHMHPTKTQISLHIWAVWSDSSLSAWRNFASLTIQIASSEDFDQTVQKSRVIWIFTECMSPRKHTYIILTLLNPTFIQWNWGLQGYTLFFLFLYKMKDCGYSFKPPCWGSCYNHNLCFEQKYETYQNFWKLSFFGGAIFNIFE